MNLKMLIPDFAKTKIKKLIAKKLLKEIFRHDRMSLVPILRTEKLSYLSDKKILALLKSLNEINDNKITGCFVEAGVALGGTLVLICGNSQGRKVYGFDTFEMIPPPTLQDPPDVHIRYAEIISGQSEGIEGDTYYGYRKDLLAFVSDKLISLCGLQSHAQTELIKGLLQETMNINQAIAFAHIDVDWYDPVKYSIGHIWPLLVTNGIVIFDDYADWGGCKKAVDEFFQDRNDYRFDLSGGNLKVTKLS